jgi:hypothetical protein
VTMRRHIVLTISVVMVAGGIGVYMLKQSQPLPFGRQDVVAVWLEPIPEGPSSPRFVVKPRHGERPLSSIEEAIPSPLPRDLWQGFRCDSGGNVVVELNNGSQIRYGPCRLPDSIEELRAHFLKALSH